MRVARLPSLVVLGLALVGCQEASTEGLGSLRVPDAGPRARDAGAGLEPDAGPGPRDAGPRDVGAPDAGPQCAAPTARGGCACNASRSPPARYVQDDCPNPSDICVPWDLVSGRQDLTGSLHRCARPCLTDDDCTGGERCGSVGIETSICVDRLAGPDEVCSGTRAVRGELVTPERAQLQPGARVGCQADQSLHCQLGVLPEAHIDEGVCLQECFDNLDCGFRERPYCNPNVLPPRGDRATGVCSARRIPRGGICGSEDPRLQGFMTRCDSSSLTPPGTACVEVPGLLREGQGICMTPCQGAGDCPADGPSSTCSQFGGGLGLCTDGCSAYPEDCEGPGVQGAGRVCMDYFGDENGDQVGFCMDREPPPLTAARFGPGGMVIDMGDNCFPNGELGGTDFLRCPEGTSCFIVDFQQGVGLCLYGCDPAISEGNPVCTRQFGAESTCESLGAGGPGIPGGYCTSP